ncbi:Rieske 2Fe-2S domain-containing protein [Novosphingobium sp. FSY-8]|uniref:Rieske 2Fe-2S domain-containing protein n=1 Tax=Novosphingobium ovatum TaxID=1908523 RepID=A0ABW9XAA1_9SPHN|nr:aromatic ring-hydroxylating dioxygenase subunit alpha [Novosphingobium ovatum]NBC35430.1 Rieske 2Fe-2S domain-containing protein [Novosphingobium ovatum]
MTYARNVWYVAGWEMDLAVDTPMAITILNQPLVIWRDGAGDVHALEDRCVHRHAPLSLGRCEGANLRCMYHGLLFGPDGVVSEIPGQEKIPPQARVRAYPVMVRHSWIWVWMGDPSLADVALIPPAVGYDDGDYILGHGQLDYDAPARLINDNLLDFSHLTYVHAASFQAGPVFAQSLPVIEPLARGVRISRWTQNTPAQRARSAPELYDNYMCYDFLLPGVLLMWSASYAVGTAVALDFGVPDKGAALTGLNHTSQAVTPMSDGTARYFFNWGPHRAHGDVAMRDGMMALAAQAFAEDKVMIEAQAKVIARDPSRPIMPTAHDRAVTLFNRLVERMVAQEA